MRRGRRQRRPLRQSWRRGVPFGLLNHRRFPSSELTIHPCSPYEIGGAAPSFSWGALPIRRDRVDAKQFVVRQHTTGWPRQSRLRDDHGSGGALAGWTRKANLEMETTGAIFFSVVNS